MHICTLYTNTVDSPATGSQAAGKRFCRLLAFFLVNRYLPGVPVNGESTVHIYYFFLSQFDLGFCHVYTRFLLTTVTLSVHSVLSSEWDRAAGEPV